MVDIIREFALTFVPLFVAMDPVGNLPIFLALTQEIEPKHRRHAVYLAALTALGVGLAFVAIGKAIFLLLGIDVADFLMAGGIILLILAVRYLITGKVVETEDLSASETVGVVPLGTPLLFRQADRIVEFLGRSGANAISKIVMLLLAAIAVKMIRQGVLTILG
jgi:multiple antibiotic resistance protein